jgi:hypothetical protein
VEIKVNRPYITIIINLEVIHPEVEGGEEIEVVNVEKSITMVNCCNVPKCLEIFKKEFGKIPQVNEILIDGKIE